MLQSSIKTNIEYFTGSVWALPKTFSLGNYLTAINVGFTKYYLNSIFVSFVSLFIIIISASMAGYMLAKIKFRLNKLIFSFFLAGMMIPIHITLIPIYKLTEYMGLYDTLTGLIGPYVAFSLPISIFILTGFIKEIPNELEEAAYIDGANTFQIFVKIIFPLIKPAVSTVAIYNLVMLWNEFIYALVLISNPDKWNLTLGLWNFQGEYGVNIPMVMSGLVLSILPLLLFYILLQERVIKGMTAGAVKG
ncbi:MAG: carbohydrate ABC transporter permease [Firmicutes bacterium]|nr:carbohydrate ABC transporter permease [Bacillota bacterium]